MRLGKIEKKVLKVLYKEEKGKDYCLRPKEIVLRITKMKFPSEQSFGINKNKKLFYIMWLYQVANSKIPKIEKKGLMNDNPQNKIYEKIREERKKWNKETNSIFRALRQLYSKGLIIRRGHKIIYKLTEKGRRVISHRK